MGRVSSRSPADDRKAYLIGRMALAGELVDRGLDPDSEEARQQSKLRHDAAVKFATMHFRLWVPPYLPLHLARRARRQGLAKAIGDRIWALAVRGNDAAAGRPAARAPGPRARCAAGDGAGDAGRRGNAAARPRRAERPPGRDGRQPYGALLRPLRGRRGYPEGQGDRSRAIQGVPAGYAGRLWPRTWWVGISGHAEPPTYRSTVSRAAPRIKKSRILQTAAWKGPADPPRAVPAREPYQASQGIGFIMFLHWLRAEFWCFGAKNSPQPAEIIVFPAIGLLQRVAQLAESAPNPCASKGWRPPVSKVQQ